MKKEIQTTYVKIGDGLHPEIVDSIIDRIRERISEYGKIIGETWDRPFYSDKELKKIRSNEGLVPEPVLITFTYEVVTYDKLFFNKDMYISLKKAMANHLMSK